MTLLWWSLSAVCWALVPVVGPAAVGPAAVFAITGAAWAVRDAMRDDEDDDDDESDEV
jgi:hypothetical protein